MDSCTNLDNAQPMVKPVLDVTNVTILPRCIRPSAAPRKNTTKSRQRHSKRLHAVEEADQQTKSDQESLSSNESYTLGMYPLRIDGIEKPTVWLSKVETKGGNITLKLDTGAEANVIPIEVFNQLTNRPKVHPTKDKANSLWWDSNQALRYMHLQCTSKHKCCNVKFYAVNADSQPILGLADCENLGYVKRVNAIEVDGLSKEALRVHYKEVFRGLGSLGKYHITLREGCTPVVHSARCLPHSLKERLKQTLDSNVKSGVLCKVDQPTDWVNNLVVVEKRNGSLRLCLDPKELSSGNIIKYQQFKKFQVNSRQESL